jgi:transposase-like protein
MLQCKKCWWTAFHKAWFIRWNQRYKCKNCGCLNTETQQRSAPMKVKLQALQLYTLWLWLRGIWKFLWYSNVAILKWIKSFWKLAEKIHEENKLNPETYEYIELDELYTYVKKNDAHFEYGLLCLKDRTNLLILP